MSGNVAENWARFIQRFEFFTETASSVTALRTDEQKGAFLLYVARHEAIDVFNTFTLSDDQRETYAAIAQTFQEEPHRRLTRPWNAVRFARPIKWKVRRSILF